MRSVECSIDSRFPSAQTILRCLASTPLRMCSSAPEHQIEWLNRLLSFGCVHPFEKAVDEGVVLEGVFRAPLAHWMRIAPLAAAVATAHEKKSWSITKDSTGVTAIVRVTNIIHQEQQQRVGPMSLSGCTGGTRSLAAAAPGVLPPENLPHGSPHRRGRLRRAYQDMLGVTSIVRALNLDARFATMPSSIASTVHAVENSSPAHRAVDPGLVLRLFPSRCAFRQQVCPGRRRHQDFQSAATCKMPAVKLLHPAVQKQIPSPNTSRERTRCRR